MNDQYSTRGKKRAAAQAQQDDLDTLAQITAQAEGADGTHIVRADIPGDDDVHKLRVIVFTKR